MTVDILKLKDFRNYESCDINFSGGINLLYGANGQGKTNILEALYMSATTRSHRGNRDKELIRFSCDEAHIKTQVERIGVKKTVDIHLKSSRPKGIAVNRVHIRRSVDLFGVLNTVIFAPEDLDIIKNGPDQRRRFMDMELCQLDRVYLSDLTNYNKVLKNRSKLLKNMYKDRFLIDTLDVWDDQLVTYGSNIIKRRESFISELSGFFEEKYYNISGLKERISIKYEPNVSIETFCDELKRTRERDIRFEQNHVGPHRDDISFFVEDADLRKFGSQGQKRSAALSLKLSEVELVKSKVHDSPVLLLDDVLSELDPVRQLHLLKEINGIQTVMTCPDISDINKNNFLIDKIFLVNSGTVTEDM